MTGAGRPVKEAYFTPENISSAAFAMMRDLTPRGIIGFSPERSALLVIDMQVYFNDPSSHAYVPSSGAVLPGIIALADAFGRASRPVILTRHVNSEEDAGLMAGWWGDILRMEDPVSALLPELEGRGSVLEKGRYDAFLGTGLEERLRNDGVEQVVVCGVMTHLCCESTARSAFMHDLAVFFTIDGTATYNRELHVGSLRALAHGFATPVLVNDVIRRMRP